MSKMDKEKCRSACVVNTAFVLMIFNEKYKYFNEYYRAGADKSKIEMFCENAQFTVNATKGLKTDNLTADELEDLLESIAKTDFSSYDAFICFIVSYCDSQGVLGVDGDSLSVREIIRPIIKCPSLAGKPKLFFIHNCRVYKEDTGPPITTPIDADIMVVFSGVDTRDFSEKNGSWYITALTDVLKEYAHCMNLTDMLAIVNGKFFKMQDCHRKQTPVLVSTLKQTVRFRYIKPEETPRKKPKISEEKN